MNIFKDKKKRRAFIWISSVLAVIALCVGIFFIYVSDYYKADNKAIEAFSTSVEVTEEKIKGGVVYSLGENTAKYGFIFYPGGKVEHTAYEPLMREIASHGVLCVLLKMPFNLAVFDINAADGIREKFPTISDWYIGGHSLGGSMAASYAVGNAEDFCGLVLLASYSTENLVKTDLSVLSIYGSEDKVLNEKKYKENRKNLPDGFSEHIIEGGNHANFGTYGKQSGDGVANISPEEQIRTTAKIIADFFLE